MEFMWHRNTPARSHHPSGGRTLADRVSECQTGGNWRENALEKLIFIMLKASRIAALCQAEVEEEGGSLPCPAPPRATPLTLFASAFFSGGHVKNRLCGLRHVIKEAEGNCSRIDCTI